jgi:hypothetical protein
MDQGAPYQDSYPFTDRIDYRRIVVEIPGSSIDSIVELLQAVPIDIITEKQSYMREIRKYFIHDYSGGGPDSFSFLLGDILGAL